MSQLGLGSKPADKAEAAIRTQEWALVLRDATEFEATAAARALASNPGPRYSVRPGDLLEIVYAERLKAPKPVRGVLTQATSAQVEHTAAVSHDNPQWLFEDGRESPMHYIARLAVLAALMPAGEATISEGGGFSCGVPACVDCTRVPLERKTQESRRETWYEREGA